MNVQYYQFGNPIKARYRKHYCYKCGTSLSIINHEKIVSQDSQEACYYSFSDLDGQMVGSCKFIHKVFYCPKCSDNIEFITQLNQEDIDNIINKTIAYFAKRGKKVSITKCYKNKIGDIVNYITQIEQIKKMVLIIDVDGQKTIQYEVPISQKLSYECPYYFNITKKQLIKFISSC